MEKKRKNKIGSGKFLGTFKIILSMLQWEFVVTGGNSIILNSEGHSSVWENSRFLLILQGVNSSQFGC